MPPKANGNCDVTHGVRPPCKCYLPIFLYRSHDRKCLPGNECNSLIARKDSILDYYRPRFTEGFGHLENITTHFEKCLRVA